MTEWKGYTISDLIEVGEAEVKTGPFGTQLKASDYVETGTPVINVRNIGFGTIRPEKLEFIGPETVKRLSTHLLAPNDIVFGRKGAVERHVLIREKQRNWFQGSDCLRLRLKSPRILPLFASYHFLTDEHKQWMINQCSHGATMASLNQDIISRIRFKVPPIETQHRIASVLSAYDDLIENNTQRIAILEEMAWLIYQEWFVHFRFPGHERVKMVESELGPIPEGWAVMAFTDIADVLSGGTPSKKEPTYWGGVIPFYTPRDFSTPYVLETESYITAEGLQRCNSQLYPKDSVFITARGSVGKTVLASRNMAMNQSNYALRGKDGIGQLFLHQTTLNAVDSLKSRSHGAVFDTIIVDTFRRFDLVRPPMNLVDRYEESARPLFDLMLNLLLKNQNLRTQRDLLLPKLISGEIDVSDIPKMESAAA